MLYWSEKFKRYSSSQDICPLHKERKYKIKDEAPDIRHDQKFHIV